MKKTRLLLGVLVIFALTSLCTCIFMQQRGGKLTLHTTKDGSVGFWMKGYQEVEKEIFDLQCTNVQSYISVNIYNMKDIQKKITKKDVLFLLSEDLMSRRKNPKKEKEYEKIIDGEKSIHQLIYIAERDNNPNLYCFNIIDFGEKEDRIAYVIFTSNVDYGREHLKDYNKILKSAKILQP